MRSIPRKDELSKNVKLLSQAIEKLNKEGRNHDVTVIYLTFSLMFFTLFQIILQTKEFIKNTGQLQDVDGFSAVVMIIFGLSFFTLALTKTSLDNMKLAFSLKSLFLLLVVVVLIITLSLFFSQHIPTIPSPI